MSKYNCLDCGNESNFKIFKSSIEEWSYDQDNDNEILEDTFDIEITLIKCANCESENIGND